MTKGIFKDGLDYESWCEKANIDKQTIINKKKYYSIRGKRCILTIHFHITEEMVHQFVQIVTTNKTKVKVKAFNETVKKTNNEHAHIVCLFTDVKGKAKRASITNTGTLDALYLLFKKYSINPINTDKHFLAAINYDETDKKSNDFKELLFDSILDWEVQLPYHEQVTNFIAAQKSWKDVIYSKEHGEYISSRMNWARSVYILRPHKKFQFPSGKPLNWQKEFMAKVLAAKDNRRIHWLVDMVGGNGKSDLANYMMDHNDAFVIDCGKHSDIVFAYDGQPIVVFDMTRSKAGNFPYSVTESFKNRRAFSGKYVSTTKVFDSPLVIVLANFAHDKNEYSADRICEYSVDNFKLTCYTNYASINLKKRLQEEINLVTKTTGSSINVKGPPGNLVKAKLPETPSQTPSVKRRKVNLLTHTTRDVSIC